jgi:hypothetical protein
MNRHLQLALSVLLAIGGFALLLALVAYKASQTGTTTPAESHPFGPAGAWIAYVLWRGWVLPPLGDDALIYHLPKAVLIAQNGGYAAFEAVNYRISTFPADFELLLADVFVLDGSDRATEWISVLGYVAVLVASGAIAERFWGRGDHVGHVVLLVAGAPLLLLHSAVDKNDLLFGFFVLAASLWLGRWAAEGGRPALILVIVAVALACGTKVSGPVVACGMAPVVAWAVARQRPHRGVVARLVPFAVGCFAALGGATYAVNLLEEGGLGADVDRYVARNGVDLIYMRQGYGQLWNLLRAPYLALAAAFSPRADEVWLPWSGEWWFYAKYDASFSNLGPALSSGVLLSPLLAWRYASAGAPTQRIERAAITLAALGGAAAILPARAYPEGWMTARYFLFAFPPLVCWVAAPWVHRAVHDARSRARTDGLVRLVLAAVFVGAALACAQSAPGPLDASAPDRTREWFHFAPRAASVVDGLAGPDDTVAFHADFESVVYPVFGRALRRRLVLVGVGDEAVNVPAEARWVVVDRAMTARWGHPGFQTMGQGQYFGQGAPSPADLRVIEALTADPRFERVYFGPSNQEVFHRRPVP